MSFHQPSTMCSSLGSVAGLSFVVTGRNDSVCTPGQTTSSTYRARTWATTKGGYGQRSTKSLSFCIAGVDAPSTCIRQQHQTTNAECVPAAIPASKSLPRLTKLTSWTGCGMMGIYGKNTNWFAGLIAVASVGDLCEPKQSLCLFLSTHVCTQCFNPANHIKIDRQPKPWTCSILSLTS